MPTHTQPTHKARLIVRLDRTVVGGRGLRATPTMSLALCCEGGGPADQIAYIHFARCSHRHSHSSLGPSLRPTHLPQCLHCNVPCAPHTVNQRAMCSAHGHRMTWSVGKPAGLCRRHDHASTPGTPYAWGVDSRLPRLSRLFPSQWTGHGVYARGSHNTCCARCGVRSARSHTWHGPDDLFIGPPGNP